MCVWLYTHVDIIYVFSLSPSSRDSQFSEGEQWILRTTWRLEGHDGKAAPGTVPSGSCRQGLAPVKRQDSCSAKSLRNENLSGSGLRDGGRHKVKGWHFTERRSLGVRVQVDCVRQQQ